MKNLAPLSFLIILVLLILTPFLFAQIIVTSLVKLHLSPNAALGAMIAIFVGSVINIPIKRIARDGEVASHPLSLFGLSDMMPKMGRTAHETIIAVNVGGCVIPTLLAGYEIFHLVNVDPGLLVPCAAACALNIAACYLMAQSVPGIGIVLPGFLPPLIAAGAALLIAPEQAAPIAFVAGVAGPLIGADLLHLKEIARSATGIASIGGAGTFDGIVLSGILAAYLA